MRSFFKIPSHRIFHYQPKYYKEGLFGSKKKGKRIEFKRGLYDTSLEEGPETSAYYELKEKRKRRVTKYYKIILLFILVVTVGVSYTFKVYSVWAIILTLIVLVMLIRANNKF